MADVIPIGQHPSANRCRGVTAAGKPCRNRAVEDGFCRVHAPQPVPAAASDAIEDVLAFLRRRLTGEYEVDEFGFDRDLTETLLAPIVPVSIVGSEEIYPLLSQAKPLARLMGLPYFPITPFFPWLGPLGMVPLPTKWVIEFGEPIPTEDYPDDAWQDGLTVFDLTDHVRDAIQQTLYRNLMHRRSVFF